MLLRSGDTVLQSTGGPPRGVDEDSQADKAGDPTENLGGTRLIQGTETRRGLRAQRRKSTPVGQELKAV
eukprot:12810540-Heterocapsa_arctica.AAC.1